MFNGRRFFLFDCSWLWFFNGGWILFLQCCQILFFLFYNFDLPQLIFAASFPNLYMAVIFQSNIQIFSAGQRRDAHCFSILFQFPKLAICTDCLPLMNPCTIHCSASNNVHYFFAFCADDAIAAVFFREEFPVLCFLFIRSFHSNQLVFICGQ